MICENPSLPNLIHRYTKAYLYIHIHICIRIRNNTANIKHKPKTIKQHQTEAAATDRMTHNMYELNLHTKLIFFFPPFCSLVVLRRKGFNVPIDFSFKV